MRLVLDFLISEARIGGLRWIPEAGFLRSQNRIETCGARQPAKTQAGLLLGDIRGSVAFKELHNRSVVETVINAWR
jgi:hypothetical protein